MYDVVGNCCNDKNIKLDIITFFNIYFGNAFKQGLTTYCNILTLFTNDVYLVLQKSLYKIYTMFMFSSCP